MNMKPTILRSSILTLLGLTAVSGSAISAVEPGAYDLVILTTPTKVTTYGAATVFKFGSNGAWNSSFIFGGDIPGAPATQGMRDDALQLVRPDSTLFGSGILGDGYAGVISLRVNGSGAVSVQSFSKDTIAGTAGGNFAQQHNTPADMSGSVSLATGAMTLVTTNRLGAIDSGTPNNSCVNQSGGNFCDETWNNDDIGPIQEYSTFRTGQAAGDNNTINGAVFAPIADVGDAFGAPADGDTDYEGVLVSGGDVGQNWGPGFAGVDYYEVWRAQLLYKQGVAATDTAVTSTGFPRQINVIANDFGKTPLSLTAVSTASNGTAALSGGGNITYTPNPGYNGPDSFTYTLTDGFGKNATGTVNVTVVADLVVADDDSAATAQGNVVVIDVDANDVTNAGGGASIDPTSVAPVSPTANGGMVVDNDNGSVTYTPAIDFVGVDTFTYTIQDTLNNTSSPATVTVTVSPGALTSDGTYTGTTITDTGVPDTEVQTSCVGKCFDFTITGVTQPQTLVVLPPLDSAIQSFESSRTVSGSIYRKLIGGVWNDYDTSSGDSIASARLSARGGCPGPSDPVWKLWDDAVATKANNADVCIRLVITDGGPNDADGAANGTISDPSGVGTITVSKPPTDTVSEFTKNAGGGCSLSSQRPALTSRADIGVLAVFLAGLAFWRRRDRAA